MHLSGEGIVHAIPLYTTTPLKSHFPFVMRVRTPPQIRYLLGRANVQL